MSISLTRRAWLGAVALVPTLAARVASATDVSVASGSPSPSPSPTGDCTPPPDVDVCAPPVSSSASSEASTSSISSAASSPPASSAPPASARGNASARPPDELLRLAGNCIVTGWHGAPIPPEVRRMARRGGLGGVILTNHNFGSRDELIALTTQLTALAPANARPFISADQEGGPVEHLSPPLPSFPSMTMLGQIDDEDLTHRLGAALGDELRRVGVNFDLAPVLDVRTSSSNTVVLNRVFGRDAQRVARHGRALIDGLRAANVLACAKHFPGHGDTVMDSHVGLPRVPHDLARLDAIELVPFRACAATVPAVMVAHILYTAIDPDAPSSLSRRVVEGLLRDRVGFEGVAITDDLQMAAIRRMHPIERAAELAMRAGNDLLLVAHTPFLAARAVEHLARTAERDSALRARLEQANTRIDRMRGLLTSPVPPNPFPVDTAGVVREVQRRLAALPARPGHRNGSDGPMRDPTLQR